MFDHPRASRTFKDYDIVSLDVATGISALFHVSRGIVNHVWQPRRDRPTIYSRRTRRIRIFLLFPAAARLCSRVTNKYNRGESLVKKHVGGIYIITPESVLGNLGIHRRQSDFEKSFESAAAISDSGSRAG